MSKLKEILLIIPISFFPFCLISQNYMNIAEMKEIVNKINSDSKFTKNSHIKSIEGYYKKRGKDSILISSKLFDKNGNLLESQSRRFNKIKDIDHRYYFYDSLNKRVEEYSIISFTSSNFKHDYLKYNYDSKGEIISILDGDGFNDITFYPYQSLKPIHDSSIVKTDSLGKLIYEIFYDNITSDNDTIITTEKHEYFYSSEHKLYEEKTYLSNVLYKIRKFNSEGKEIEELNFKNKRNKLQSQQKWVYKDGLLIQYINLRKNGKTKNTVNYYYSFFTR